MSAHHRINAIDNLIISSKNGGDVVLNPSVTFANVNDSFLKDLKELKGDLASGDLIKFNGSNLIAQASSEFAAASELSNYVASADLDADVSAAGYIKAAGQFVRSVGVNLAVDGSGELTVDLSSFQASASLDTDVGAAGYIKSADQYVRSVGSNLAVDGSGGLTVDLSSFQASATLDTDVGAAGYIKTAGQYVRSVGANLAVDGSGELTVDLSSVENPDLSGYLQTASLQTAITNLATLEVPAVQQGAVWSKNKTQAYTGSATECLSIACVNDKVYKIKVDAVYNNDDHTAFGAMHYEALWKRISGSASLVSGSDSYTAMGACDGSELSFVDSAGSISVRIKGSASDGVGTAGAANIQVSAQEC